ncbi:MAG: alpha-ketoacid dehydrogenase subunit beta [Chloroflexi bacterium]|nr:alpha-ketoacid dehydrogenase subunit beta [Chloroflexota bacterium]
MTRTLTYAQALAEALGEILREDERVVIFGGGFAGITPSRVHFGPLFKEFPGRFVAPPISELGLAGLGAGAAMAGLRPIVDLGTGSFVFEAFPAVANEAAIAYYTSNQQTTVPVVYHLLGGIRGAGAEQHSQAVQALFWQTPGLQIMLPGSPADVKGLVRTAALASKNPTLFVSHYRLMEVAGPVPEEPYEIPFGQAEVKRAGTDATIVACGIQVPRALEAAERLAADGVSVEVVDPRTLVPLDEAAILASVRKTGRAVVTDETPRSCGVAAELVARLVEQAWGALKTPPRRVTIPDVPIPFSEPLEAFVTPGVDRLVAAVREVLG